MDVKLACETVEFRYQNRTVLDRISFTVGRGKFCALLGRNGSGKTTLLHCLNKILTPCGGRILLNDTDIAKISQKDVARQVSLVPQEHVDIFPFTVLEVVVMGRAPYLGLTASPCDDDYALAEQTLDILNARYLGPCNFNRISGGERRIALLAGALVQTDNILLLDEPTNHLDFHNQYHLLSQIKEICQKRGTSVVAAMHDPNMARLFADQVIMIQNGRILQSGATAAVMTKPNLDRLYNTDTAAINITDTKQFFLPRQVLYD